MKKVEALSSNYVDQMSQLEETLYAKGFRVKEASQMFYMAKFKQPSKEVIGLSRRNMQFLETIRILTIEYIHDRFFNRILYE